MRLPRSLSIRTMLNLLVIACILPAALIAIGVIAYDYQRDREQLVQNTIATSRSIINLVDQIFVGVETSLLTLGTSSTLWNDDRSEFYAQAKSVLESQIGRNIVLANVQGRQLVNTLVPYGSPLNQNANAAQVAKLSLTHAPNVSDLFRGPTDNKQIVSVGVPIMRQGVHALNIHTRLLPSVFTNLLAEQALDPRWVVAITDSSGTIVARTKDNDRFMGTKASPDLLNTLLRQSEGAVDGKTLDGISVVASYSQSQATGWTVVIGIPNDLLTRELRQRVLTLILAISVVLAIGLGFTWVISGRIIKANRGLIAPALALGDGKAIRVPSFGLKEADEVGRALEKASEKLSVAQYKANHDNLTALPNRAFFYEVVSRQLSVAVRNKSVLSVLFIDLDGFKKINDQFGHAAGDEILRLVASRLNALLRQSDTSSRLGGDEFAVVLPDTGLEYAEVVANKVIDGLSVPYQVNSHVLRISASIGIAASHGESMSVESLVRAADDAMYAAKAAGKSRACIAS